MTEEKKTGAMPDFTGTAEFEKDGMKLNAHVAVWVNKDKNGNKYTSVNFGGLKANCFKFTPKQKKDQIIQEAGYPKEEVL